MSKPSFRVAGTVLTILFALLAVPLHAQVISEILFNPPGTDGPNEYVELRGTPSATLPAGTYLVGIEGDSGSPGDVQNIFDLSGKTFGSNGYLVILQKLNTYTTDANAAVLTNSGTGNGFGSGAGSSIGHSGDSGGTDIENDAVTLMLIQTGTVPTLTNDIDSDNDGNADGAVYAGWTILDSVSVLNTTAGGRGYGAFVFRNGTNGAAPGATTVVTLSFTPGYVARIGRSSGATTADWAGAAGGGTVPNFTMGTNASPASMASFPLNHVGRENAPHVLSILRNSTNPASSGSSVIFQVNFTQPVTGVDSPDFFLTTSGGITGASITSVTGSGTPFDVTVNTGSGTGTIRLDVVDDDTILHNGGSYPLGGVGLVNGNFTAGEDFTVTAAAPAVVSIVRVDADPTNASSVNFTVTFSQSVTGVDAIDFALDTTGVSGASIGTVTGSNMTWNVPVNTGTGDGSVSIDLIDNDSITNSGGVQLGGAGSGNGDFTAGDAYTIDRTAPSVQSINRAGADPTSASSVDFTVTFDENVNNVGTGNFTLDTTGVSGASVTGVTPVSDSVYTVSVNTGTGSGSIRLDLTSTGTIEDDATNALSGTFNTGETYTIDKNFPSVSSINRADASPTNADDVDFTVVFSAPVSGVDASDFDLALSGVTAAINTVASSDGGTTWNVNVNTVAGDGTLGLDLDDDNSIVAVGNSAPIGGNAVDDGDFTGQVYDIDNTVPAVTSIVRDDPNPTNATTVDFVVTFNDVVTGVGTGDFVVAPVGVTGASVTAVNGTGPYTVTVNTGSGDGAVRLDLIDDDTINDDAGNGLTAAFNTGEVYGVDKTAPSVQSVTRVNPSPTGAASVDFTVTFSEGVTGVDPSDFTFMLTGVTGVSITNIAPAGPPPPPPAPPGVYIVTVNTGIGSGTIRLDVVDDDTIVDPATNSLSAGFTGGESYTLERAPLAPQSLVATPGNNHVLLNWGAANGAVTYNVKRSTTPGDPLSPTIATGIAATSYDDLTAVNGTTYYYRVFATNAQGDGPDSNEVSATPNPLLPAPANLTAAVADAKVILDWGTVGGATTYNVNRGTTPGGPYTTVGSPATNTFTDTSVVNGTQYFYVVTAVGPESPNSNEVAAMPNTPNALGVVISQAYGGGGNTGATFKNDFIEVFNRGTQTIALTGWSVQYASATGSFSAANTVALTGAIGPGRYYLIQHAAGAGGTVDLPTPDATGTTAMSATAFKIALAAQTTALANCAVGTIADLVGAGSTANCSETATAPAPSNTNAILRDNNGCDDTNNNANDFATGAPNPRNSATPQNSCGFLATGAANPPAVDVGQNSTLTVQVTPAIAPPSSGITVVADLTAIGGSASQAFSDDGSTNGDQNAGDNIFTYIANVAIGTTAGNKNLLATVTDAEARGTTASISLTVNPALETIAAVKVDGDANTSPDRLGQQVRVRGVVTSIDFRGGNGVEYFIQDPTAGIDVFHSSTNFGPFTVGDNVDVIGSLTLFNGLTEIVPTAFTLIAPGSVPPVTPQTVTLSAINESLEGSLVRVDNLTMTPVVLAGDTNYAISDGSAGTMRVDADTNIPGTNAPPSTFSLVGLVGQFDNTNPFNSGYQILPRSTADIIPRTAPTGAGAANPPSVPPGATTLLTVNVTPGQNPPSTGITVIVDLSSIGLSATQSFFDDGSNGDVAPSDNIFSFSATVDGGTTLGPKTLPVAIADAEARNSATNIPLNIQSPSAPPPPANLVATPGNAQVALDWDPSLGASDYNVKRSTVSGGPYTTIASNVVPDSYTDTSVTNGVTYYYVVSALSGANESGDSAQVSATPTAPPPTGPLARIYFVDIGQGAGTLIVGPTGTSMLVDAGPTGQGNSKVLPLLNAVLPPGDRVDYTIVTHYHVDHDAGMTEVINAGMLDGGIAYDNGDAPHVVPPVPSNSTGTAFTAYKNAITSRSGAVTRTTITPGLVIDLGGGMKATCLVAGGSFASGGNVYVSGTDLNSSSISTLIQYENFDYLVSGDLTGGGSTTTAKTPDVETFVAQMAGDVDVVQLDHHGSTTANNRRFLGVLKAEMSFASIGTSNTFGHPNRETVNRYLNIPVTSGNTFPGEGVPNPGNGPVHYQTEASPPSDNRTTVQFHSGASAGNAGQGTLLLETDGVISFTLESFDDGGVRINPAQHVYAIDGQGLGVATDFPSTVIPYISPGVPTAADVVTITALVNDVQPITSVTLDYSLNGAVQAPVTMTPTGSEFSANIPAQPNATRVDYTITAVANGLTATYSNGYFSGTTPVANLRSLNALGEPNYLDYAARIAGLATSTTGDYSTSNNDDYLDDGRALNVSRTIEPDVPATQTMTAGNTYTVAGLISQLTGRFRLDVTPPFDGITKPWDAAPGSYNPFGITVTGAGTVTPQTKTIAQILADPEGHEAYLVSIANVTITSGTIPASGGLDAFLTINDGTGSMEMKIDSDGDIPGLATPAGSFTLLGIVQQDDFLRPFSTRHTIAPRNRTDLGAAAGGPALITIAEAREDVDGTTGTTPDDFVPDRLGQQVKVRGVVTSINFRPSGTEVYIQDPTAGIVIFASSLAVAMNIGDSVEVTGTVTQFNGLTEIVFSSIANVSVLAPGTMPPAVLEVVTLSQLADGGIGEAYEGRFIRVNNVTLTSPPATFASNTNYAITDSTGGAQMRIDGDTDIDGTAPPASPFSIIGVLGQFDGSNPFDSGYQFFPRIRATDFVAAVPAAAAITATAGTPQSTLVGTPFTTDLQATVTDAGSAPIQGIGVTFTAPASGASGTFANGTTSVNVATNASGIATATIFTANAIAGVYNVAASTNSLTANFNLENTEPPAATHFSVTAPANVNTGAPFNVTVTALDASEATVTGYTGTVTFTSSSTGTLPGDYTFVAGDNGSQTFSVTLTQAGAQSVTATDTVTASITGTGNTTVDDIPVLTIDDISTLEGDSGTHQATLTVTKTGTTSQSVSFDFDLVAGTATCCGSDFSGPDGTSTFQPNQTTKTINITVFGDINFEADETVFVDLSNATNGATIGDNQGVLTILNDDTPATHFSVTAPANVNTGVPFNVTVTALDASEAVTGYLGTVHFTSSSTGTLPGDYTFVNADQGSHTFSVTLTQAGAQSITATDTVTASITGTGNTTVDDIPVLTIDDISTLEGDSGTHQATLTVTKTGTTSQSVSFNWNLVAGTATCCGNDFSGPDGSTTFQPNQTTKTINITVFGDINFEADETVFVDLSNATGGATIGDDQGVITILNDDTPATHFSVTAPANVSNGVPFNVTVTALDSSNAVTGYLGTVHFTSSSTGTLPADYTFVNADQGSHTFSVTLTSNGAQTITATDTVTASINGTANTTVGIVCPPPPPQVAPNIVTSPFVCANSAGNVATMTGGAGTFVWSIANGVITSGQGTSSIHYTAGASGSVALSVESSTGGACPIEANAFESVPITPLPAATLPSDVTACAGTLVTLTATLTGTAPFTVVWSDGVTQSGILTTEVDRVFTAVADSTMYVASVTDAFCTNAAPSNDAFIHVQSPPVIQTQPGHVKINSGGTATLTVGTTSSGVSYQWYQGSVGNTSIPVGTNSPSFTTPALTRTTRYWVRITNDCGSIDSNLAVVTVTGRRRSVRH